MVRLFKFFRGVLPVSAGITLLFFATARAHGKNLSCAHCGPATRQKSPLSETSLKLAEAITNLLKWSISVHTPKDGIGASFVPSRSGDYDFLNSGPAPFHRPVHLMQFPKPISAEDAIALPNSLGAAANRPAWYNQALDKNLSQLDPTFRMIESPSASWYSGWGMYP